ncbi:MAG: T9SS type A sorting domain-containing protein [Saprospiraceae bacterium]|nr:T9SS type A sorting domain-containing protein [Saprospiraceae bacterium]
MQRKVTIPLGFDIPAGTGYRINASGTTTDLYRNKDNNNSIALVYPYNLDNAASITGPINNLFNSYYFFYNWKVTYLGCPSERIPVQATVNPSGLTPNFAVTHESLPGNGGINTTVSGGASPYSFHWSNGGTTANLAGLNAGTYMVTISDANGCTDTFSTVIDYTVSTAEIASISNLNIFPNPSNGQFNVSIELDGIHEVAIEVVNTLGQVIYRTSPENIAARQYPMNLDDVPSGLYQIRIRVDNESLSRTIMINHRN